MAFEDPQICALHQLKSISAVRTCDGTANVFVILGGVKHVSRVQQPRHRLLLITMKVT